MVAAANMVEIAALVGDTARATMLAALMSGQALTSSELAGLAHVSRATHLTRIIVNQQEIDAARVPASARDLETGHPSCTGQDWG